MHMRQWKKPRTVDLDQLLPDGHPARRYTAEMFYGEYIWSYPRWSEPGWDETQVRIGDALDVTAPGDDMPPTTTEDWERVLEAYTKNVHPQTGMPLIQGIYAPKLRRMGLTIRDAKTVEEKATANGKEVIAS